MLNRLLELLAGGIHRRIVLCHPLVSPQADSAVGCGDGIFGGLALAYRLPPGDWQRWSAGLAKTSTLRISAPPQDQMDAQTRAALTVL
jgi:hypothetical protein